MARHNPHCVCRRFASDFYFFRSSRSSLPDLIRQSMPKWRLRMLPPAFARCSSAWTTGSSPVVTSKRQWLAIARALSRAARKSRHCERSEAIQSEFESLDCFVTNAPRNDEGDARTMRLIRPRAAGEGDHA